MLFALGPVSVDLVQEFYSNLGDCSDGYFETCLQGHTIRMTSDLINILTSTPRVPNFAYPWPSNDQPSLETMVECFAEG